MTKKEQIEDRLKTYVLDKHHSLDENYNDFCELYDYEFDNEYTDQIYKHLKSLIKNQETMITYRMLTGKRLEIAKKIEKKMLGMNPDRLISHDVCDWVCENFIDFCNEAGIFEGLDEHDPKQDDDYRRLCYEMAYFCHNN